ncbi:MAG: 4Fe-4S binding protein [Deltaproteobacteria bacterium]|nr:4Fe-4S binding protein [Deltaproteobacteria bacterium]
MTWWTRALKSLISFGDGQRFDLFRIFPAFRRFLAARHHYAQLRTAADTLFVLVLISGFFGPQDAHRNIAVFLTWGILWPAIVLSWFFVGRMWCGICPFPGLGVFLQRRGWSFSLKVPKVLQKYGVYCSVSLLALIIWFETVADLNQWPAGTSYLVLSIVLGSALMAVLFPGQSWCRHLCPLGRISGAAATISITEFRADHDKCRGCQSFACKKGADGKRGCPVYLGAVSVQNNLHCLVCGHCLPLCDRDSPQFLFRNPYNELIYNAGRYITCMYTVPFLIGSQFARFIIGKSSYRGILERWGTPDSLLFSILLLVCIALVLVVIRIGNRLFGVTEKDPIVGRLSPMVPILIPMAFTGELVYRMAHFAEGIGDFIPTIGRQFGVALLERLSFTIPEFPVQVLSAFFMMNGAIAGGYILWRYCLGPFEGLLDLKNFVIIHLLLGGTLFSYLMVIF